MKKLLFLSVSALGLFACSGENSSSSDSSSQKDGVEIVEMQANVKYDKTDSALTISLPVCKLDANGKLLWEEAGSSLESKKVLVIKGYNAAKKTAKIVELGDDDSDSYRYEADEFPYGLWVDSETESDNFYDAFSFGENGEFKKIELYRGDCFAKDILPEIRDEFDDAEIGTLSYKNCSEITFLEKGVIKLKDLESDGINFSMSYGDVSCDVSVKHRYAVYEEDCKAAYEEFLTDEEADKKFEFDDYSEAFVGDEECLTELFMKIAIAQMK